MPSSPDRPTVTFADAIAARRMTRNFSDAPVHPALVDQLIAWAHRGPSAGNSQSLHVLLLQDADVDRYWDTTLAIESRASFPWPGLLVAPVLMIPWVEPSRYVERYAEPDKARTGLGEGEHVWGVPYWWVDGGASVQSVLLGASALELGACFFGQFDHEPSVREAFGVPDGFRALGTIAIGHPSDAGERRSLSATRGHRPDSETVHWGMW